MERDPSGGRLDCTLIQLDQLLTTRKGSLYERTDQRACGPDRHPQTVPSWKPWAAPYAPR